MSDKVLVKPTINPATKKPYVVRQPERGYEVLPADGARVFLNTFYRRRLAEGAIEVVTATLDGKTNKRGGNR